jgi:hypothetical protein
MDPFAGNDGLSFGCEGGPEVVLAAFSSTDIRTTKSMRA